MINDTELLLNQDGSVYHLNLLPEDIAETIIFVADPDRVPLVSQYFDEIEVKKGKREFVTHTGVLNHKRISVVSTGIGTDNIDVVLNEIDALFNIDLATKALKDQVRTVDIVRIGTSGSIQGGIGMDNIVVSEYAIGFDALMQFYKKTYTDEELAILDAVERAFRDVGLRPYVGRASKELMEKYAFDLPKGITMTAAGFYGPQGRHLRTQNALPNFLEIANHFELEGRHITNLETETAGIYALSNTFGHRAVSINAILASRIDSRISQDPQAVIDRTIRLVLERF